MSNGGHVRRRGASSWEVKFDIGTDPATGRRRTRYETVKGTKRDAERRLRELLTAADKGAHVDPSRMTVAEYLRHWLAAYARDNVAPKTFERFSELAEHHLIPGLGGILLRQLAPLHIQSCYAESRASGRRDGKGGLSARTVHHAHRLLFQALRHAVAWRMLTLNPAADVKPPRPENHEVDILAPEEVAALLKTVRRSRHYAPILLAATTGLRRGELLALRWSDIDMAAGVLTVNQAVEQTKAGLAFKAPKTKGSRRSVTLPAVTVEALKAHRARQAEERLLLGLGRDDRALVFTRADGEPLSPRHFTKEFARHVRNAGVRRITLHALRHTHISQLLRDGVHLKVVSERAGHASPTVTLNIYAHVIPNMQTDAAAKVDAAIRAALQE